MTNLNEFAERLMNFDDDLCPHIDMMAGQEQDVARYFDETPTEELPDSTMTKADYEDHANALEDLSTALEDGDLEATEQILARLRPQAISYLESLMEE